MNIFSVAIILYEPKIVLQKKCQNLKISHIYSEKKVIFYPVLWGKQVKVIVEKTNEKIRLENVCKTSIQNDLIYESKFISFSFFQNDRTKTDILNCVAIASNEKKSVFVNQLHMHSLNRY